MLCKLHLYSPQQEATRCNVVLDKRIAVSETHSGARINPGRFAYQHTFSADMLLQGRTSGRALGCILLSWSCWRHAAWQLNAAATDHCIFALGCKSLSWSCWQHAAWRHTAWQINAVASDQCTFALVWAACCRCGAAGGKRSLAATQQTATNALSL